LSRAQPGFRCTAREATCCAPAWPAVRSLNHPAKEVARGLPKQTRDSARRDGGPAFGDERGCRGHVPEPEADGASGTVGFIVRAIASGTPASPQTSRCRAERRVRASAHSWARPRLVPLIARLVNRMTVCVDFAADPVPARVGAPAPRAPACTGVPASRAVVDLRVVLREDARGLACDANSGARPQDQVVALVPSIRPTASRPSSRLPVRCSRNFGGCGGSTSAESSPWWMSASAAKKRWSRPA
jgi:hypothetical protein